MQHHFGIINNGKKMKYLILAMALWTIFVLFMSIIV